MPGLQKPLTSADLVNRGTALQVNKLTFTMRALTVLFRALTVLMRALTVLVCALTVLFRAPAVLFRTPTVLLRDIHARPPEAPHVCRSRQSRYPKPLILGSGRLGSEKTGVSGSEFRVSGFGFQASDFRLRVHGLGFRVSNFRLIGGK